MKLLILIAYFIVLITIGFVCRQKATDVNGFVLGGRSVGPWLTAFAYGIRKMKMITDAAILRDLL